jgi:hypothetical protein
MSVTPPHEQAAALAVVLMSALVCASLWLVLLNAALLAEHVAALRNGMEAEKGARLRQLRRTLTFKAVILASSVLTFLLVVALEGIALHLLLSEWGGVAPCRVATTVNMT